LDLDRSPGTDQSDRPALVYDSAAADPRPILHAYLQTDSAAALPSTITVQLTWDGVPQQSKVYGTSGIVPGEWVVAAVQAPLSTTGRHRWKVDVTLNYGTPIVLTREGITYAVDLRNSPYGPGWSFSMIERLIDIPQDAYGPAGQLRLFGTGGWRFYEGTSGTLTGPAWDFGSLVKNGNGTFTYTAVDGWKREFNAAGMQTAHVRHDGNELLSYTYIDADSDLQVDDLATMTAIDGAASTFNYSGARLSSISTAGPRTFTLNNGTDLVSVTNPDTGVHTFGYDGSHHLISETFGGLVNGWTYGTDHGRLTSYAWGPSNFTLVPIATQGYYTLAKAPLRARQTNPRGYTTTWALDNEAFLLDELAADGGLWAWTRDATYRWVNAFIDPLGRPTTYLHSTTTGYVTRETFADGAFRLYDYDSRPFHALTLFTNERGHTSTWSYDDGHLLTFTNALTQITSYTWLPNGLLQDISDLRPAAPRHGGDQSHRRADLADQL
jgi:YD repeat-containing protein